MLLYKTWHRLDFIGDFLVPIGAMNSDSDVERLPGGETHRERSDPVQCVLELSEGNLRATDATTRLAGNDRAKLSRLENQIQHTKSLLCEFDELIVVSRYIQEPLRLLIKGHFDPLRFFVG